MSESSLPHNGLFLSLRKALEEAIGVFWERPSPWSWFLMEGATGGEILIKHGGAGAELEGADRGNDP